MTSAVPPADALTGREIAVGCRVCGAPTASTTGIVGRDRFVGGPGSFEAVRCAGCGLVATTPTPRSEDFALYYPESYSTWDLRATGEPRGRLQRLRERVDHRYLERYIRSGPFTPIGRSAPGRLLDVGCGTGELALAFARLGWQSAGIEPGELAAAVAGAHGVEMHHGTIETAPWGSAEFDVVTFNHSLEHIDDPVGALRRAHELLRPGGLLGVAVPNFDSLQRRWFRGRWFGLDVPRHLQHFEPATLRAIVTRAGFEPIALSAASARYGLLTSLEYAVFGRVVLGGRARWIAAQASRPVLDVIDRLGPGDCLHLVGRR